MHYPLVMSTAIFLNFNASTYTFNERDGTVANVRVQKNANSPDTEVDFPIQVLTLNGTATAGTGKYFSQEISFLL